MILPKALPAAPESLFAVHLKSRNSSKHLRIFQDILAFVFINNYSIHVHYNTIYVLMEETIITEGLLS